MASLKKTSYTNSRIATHLVCKIHHKEQVVPHVVLVVNMGFEPVGTLLKLKVLDRAGNTTVQEVTDQI